MLKSWKKGEVIRIPILSVSYMFFFFFIFYHL